MENEVSVGSFSNFETIIKIDVEGFEEEVLKGAVKTIDRFRPTILFEYAPEYLPEDSRIRFYWEKLPNYVFFTIGERFTLNKLDSELRQENCIAIAREKMPYFSKLVV